MNATQTALRTFRRRIRLTLERGRVHGGLEDDFHHFTAEIEHDGERVTALRSQPLRVPRSNCPEAAVPLQDFVGLALDLDTVPIDPRLQCTHLFDLVRAMMSHAWRARSEPLPLEHDYAIEVPYPEGNRLHAQIRHNGELLLAWELVDRRIVTPGPFEGIDFRDKPRWPEELDAATLEIAKMLRRGVWLGEDRARGAAALASGVPRTQFSAFTLQRFRGKCFAHQPENQAGSTGGFGTNIRDFSEAPEQMLAR